MVRVRKTMKPAKSAASRQLDRDVPGRTGSPGQCGRSARSTRPGAPCPMRRAARRDRRHVGRRMGPSTGSAHATLVVPVHGYEARRGKRWYPPLLRVLFILTGAGRRTMANRTADLRSMAEVHPAVAHLALHVPLAAAVLEDLEQQGPSTPVWTPLTSPAVPNHGPGPTSSRLRPTPGDHRRQGTPYRSHLRDSVRSCATSLPCGGPPGPKTRRPRPADIAGRRHSLPRRTQQVERQAQLAVAAVLQWRLRVLEVGRFAVGGSVGRAPGRLSGFPGGGRGRRPHRDLPRGTLAPQPQPARAPVRLPTRACEPPPCPASPIHAPGPSGLSHPAQPLTQ